MKLSKKVSKHIRRSGRPMPLFAYALFIVLCFVLIGILSALRGHAASVDRLVTFHDRGKERVILTHAQTVQDALKAADISVTPQDIVEPAIGSELLSTDSAVIIYRARMILVVDGALREKVMTAAAAPNEIVTTAGMAGLNNEDKTTFSGADLVTDGASTKLSIERKAITPIKVAYVPGPRALSKSKGAQMYTDADGVVHRETYYDLPMNIVIGACGPGDYTIRSDGAKVDKDGYVLVAASYRNYPRCSIVETSMGPGKVYDTGGFALRYPHGFDLATDWTNYNGR